MGEEAPEEMQTSGVGGQEEKILVSVRLRPLNEKEVARRDTSDWQCIDKNTIAFKRSLPERSMFPTSYTFDRVFGCECPTKEVYEEGAKKIALSVVKGINSTVFAYGQTSSGKTYTMGGITKLAVADIYDYIAKHRERDFVLKFSAMEIYNEAVRDLLSSDSTPLRLLDDPERGTVVERLTEETLRDWNHLQELLSICEAERQVGETNLNETSSRSHQILRLIVESSAHQYAGARNSSTLAASVNFVDLAGSERASQTQSAGTRLKEGCHINRSLLTLGTVIRKLSKGRNAHVPYRDSKLTRILQNSLGGNARTAIICTMSPAHSHVEQSRNTLLFASCAKEVSTNAQVNLVMSDKVLVKQLQRELAKLASEMKSLGSADSTKLVKEKELLIEQMSTEIKELTQQRDLAQSRVENLLRSSEETQKLKQYGHAASEASALANCLRSEAFNKCLHFQKPRVSNFDNELLENPEDNFLLDDSTPKFGGPDLCQGWEEIAQRAREESEDICKEVRCVEVKQFRFNSSMKADGGEGILLIADAIRKKREPEDFSADSEEKEGKYAIEIPINDEILYPPKEDGKLDEKMTLREDALHTEEKQGKLAAKTLVDKDIFNPVEDEERFAMKMIVNEDASHPEETEGKISAKTPSNKDVPPMGKGNWHLNQANSDETYDALNQKIQELQRTIDILISSYPREESPCASEAYSPSSLSLNKSRSCRASFLTMPSPVCFEKAEYYATTPPPAYEKNFPGRPRGLYHLSPGLNYGNTMGKRSRKAVSLSDPSVEIQSLGNSDSDNDTKVHDFVSTPNETCQKLSESQANESKLLTRKQLYNDPVEGHAYKIDEGEEERLETENSVPTQSNWPVEFETQQRSIIELWDACNVPLVHRSYFFLLFKGDPSDAVYLEVELRRLNFLKSSTIQASSTKELIHEREMLARQIHRKFYGKEKEQLYQKWGIELRTKQRSVQLARCLWANTEDWEHIKESAALVAKLVGFEESSQAPKEVIGLSIFPRFITQRSYGWRHLKSLTSLF